MNDHERLAIYAKSGDLEILRMVYVNQVDKLKEWLDRDYAAADSEKCITFAFMEAAADPKKFERGVPSLWSRAAKIVIRERCLAKVA